MNLGIIYGLLLSMMINYHVEDPEIYLIRHASVDLKKPVLCNLYEIYNYKKLYNKSDIIPFNPDIVLNQIYNSQKIDTVFCSTQLRAIQTSKMLFDSTVIIVGNNGFNELDYNIINIPLIYLPTDIWLGVSRIFSPNLYDKDSTKQAVSIVSKYAIVHGKAILVGHGLKNRKIVRLLKRQGWKKCSKISYSNLSVICMELENEKR